LKFRTVLYTAIILSFNFSDIFSQNSHINFENNKLSKTTLAANNHQVIFPFLPKKNLAIEESYSENAFIFSSQDWALIGISGVQLVFLIDSYNNWWKEEKHSFHFYNPENEGWKWFGHPTELGIDKISHFYGSYFFYHFQKNILIWGGHTKETAMLVSSLYTLGNAILVEIGDGYSPYGASYEDLLFNMAGLGYGILQDKFPFLYNFNFKFSFYPTGGYSFPPQFTNHYEGQIFWLTINVANIFKTSVGKFLPNWIQPAVGYSISVDYRREFTIGLDFSLTPLFNTSVPAAKFTDRTLNLFHLPAPGVKFTEGKKPEYKLFLLN